MRSLILSLILITPVVFAQDILIRDGATCDIPDKYNAAAFDGQYNAWGMGEFCVFPFKPLVDAINKKLDNCEATPPEIPECGGLVISPSVAVFPCYEIRTE
jgi:hypothetical protein